MLIELAGGHLDGSSRLGIIHKVFSSLSGVSPTDFKSITPESGIERLICHCISSQFICSPTASQRSVPCRIFVIYDKRAYKMEEHRIQDEPMEEAPLQELVVEEISNGGISEEPQITSQQLLVE